MTDSYRKNLQTGQRLILSNAQKMLTHQIIIDYHCYTVQYIKYKHLDYHYYNMQSVLQCFLE